MHLQIDLAAFRRTRHCQESRRVRLLAASAVASALILACGGRSSYAEVPLFSGSRYTAAARDQAVLRGLDFIYGTAEAPQNFADYASDYLWCFYSIGASAKNEALRERSLRYGRTLARRWLAGAPAVTPASSADDISELSMALEASEKLGVSAPRLREALKRAVPRFSAVQFLGFDPRQGPPPRMTLRLEGEEACAAAGLSELVGVEDCPDVEKQIRDLDIFYDAMITTYFGDWFGVTHGATYDQLMAWKHVLLPYPERAEIGAEAFYDLVYIVTHIVYTHNDYGKKALRPSDLRAEYEFLSANFAPILAEKDAETFAEFVDTLKSFGLRPDSHATMARAIDELIALQNADGSWGAVEGEDVDIYDRYHSTWTAIDALRDYVGF